MSDSVDIILGMFLGMILTLMIGVMFLSNQYSNGRKDGVTLTNNTFHEEAIKRGFAHYDTKTGNWQWNN